MLTYLLCLKRKLPKWVAFIIINQTHEFAKYPELCAKRDYIDIATASCILKIPFDIKLMPYLALRIAAESGYSEAVEKIFGILPSSWELYYPECLANLKCAITHNCDKSLIRFFIYSGNATIMAGTVDSFIAAARSGDFAALYEKYHVTNKRELLYAAAATGNEYWFNKLDFQDHQSMFYAIEGGNLNIIKKYNIAKSCHTANIFSGKSGKQEVVEYIGSAAKLYPSKVVKGALSKGHLELALKYGTIADKDIFIEYGYNFSCLKLNVNGIVC